MLESESQLRQCYRKPQSQADKSAAASQNSFTYSSYTGGRPLLGTARQRLFTHRCLQRGRNVNANEILSLNVNYIAYTLCEQFSFGTHCCGISGKKSGCEIRKSLEGQRSRNKGLGDALSLRSFRSRSFTYPAAAS